MLENLDNYGVLQLDRAPESPAPQPDTLLDVSPEALAAHGDDDLDISSVHELETSDILKLYEAP